MLAGGVEKHYFGFKKFVPQTLPKLLAIFFPSSSIVEVEMSDLQAIVLLPMCLGVSQVRSSRIHPTHSIRLHQNKSKSSSSWTQSVL